MKITCQRDKLLAAFQTAASVAPARSPKPILQNVKLDVTSEGATLLATDLEVGIRIAVTGLEVQAPGSVVLPLARFGPILRESTDATLSIETDGRNTIVKGDRSEFKLAAENPAEFPSVAEFSESKYHEVPARAFRELIRRTIFATDNESSRYALGGVLLEFAENHIIGVGTDGRRLAKMQIPANSVGGHHTISSMTIVPTKAMQLIERALSDSDEEVRIAARPSEILVQNSRLTLYSRLVEGRFPKWRDVFPNRTGTVRVDLTVGPFYSAVRQAAILTNDDSRGVDFVFGDGMVTLSGKAADAGQSKVQLPISYDGESMGIALDPKFFSEFLRVLDNDKVFTLDLKDSDSAAVAHTDDDYGYVIMPLARDH